MKITALIFTLLVAASVLEACVLPYYRDARPGIESGLPAGEARPTVTTRAALIGEVGYPDFRTPDERFFLYRNNRCIRRAGLCLDPCSNTYDCFAHWVLVEFDKNGVVKAVSVTDCKGSCGSAQIALATLLEERYSAALAAEYQRMVAQAGGAPSAVAGEPMATHFGPFSLGDSFVYETPIPGANYGENFEDRYLREENGQYVFERAFEHPGPTFGFLGLMPKLREAVCTFDGNWVRWWRTFFSKKAVTADPHNGMLKFPMKVGMSWTHSYTFTDPPVSTIRTATMTVRKYEQIETPAGKFWAFKIERIDQPVPNADFAVEIYWFAPVIGQIVRFRSDEEELDLTSYRKAVNP